MERQAEWDNQTVDARRPKGEKWGGAYVCLHPGSCRQNDAAPRFFPAGCAAADAAAPPTLAGDVAQLAGQHAGTTLMAHP